MMVLTPSLIYTRTPYITGSFQSLRTVMNHICILSVVLLQLQTEAHLRQALKHMWWE